MTMMMMMIVIGWAYKSFFCEYNCTMRHCSYCRKRIRPIHEGQIHRAAKKKIAQSLMHHYFAAVLRRITQFAQKCSAKITVCQSEQTFCQWVKYTLINSRNWTHVICEVTCFQPVTGENRLLFPTSLSSQTGYLTHLI